MFSYKIPALAALLASTTLATACTGNTAQDNAEPLDQSVGSTVDVQQAKVAVKDVPMPETAEYSWLLAQIEHRCVRERGGDLPDAIFTIQKPPQEPISNNSEYRNAWLVPPVMQYTKTMKSPNWRQERDRAAQDGNEPDIKVGKKTLAIRYGVPKHRISLVAADGTVVQYPTAGCAGEAIKKLYGVTPEVFYTTRLKIGNIHRTAQTVTSTPALSELHDRYMPCLKEQGQVVRSIDSRPQQLNEELDKVQEGKSTIVKLEKLEKKYIAADALCRKQERIGEVYSHHYNKAATKIVEENQSALVAHKEMSEHAAKVRKEYLAKHHS